MLVVMSSPHPPPSLPQMTTNCSSEYSVWSNLATWDEEYSHSSSFSPDVPSIRVYLASLKDHFKLLKILLQNHATCFEPSVKQRLATVRGILKDSTLPLGSKWVSTKSQYTLFQHTSLLHFTASMHITMSDPSAESPVRIQQLLCINLLVSHTEIY